MSILLNFCKQLVVMWAVVMLLACGGSDDIDRNLQVGRISATPIQNLRYKTPTQEGRTGADGSFTYLPGETVQFFIGHIPLDPVLAQSSITLLDIAGTQSPSNTKVVNMSRLFQSLDDPADGVITISQNVDRLGCTIDKSAFDFSAPTTEFESTQIVSDFVKAVSVTGAMVTADFAQDNLENALRGAPLVSSTLPDAYRALGTAGSNTLQPRALVGTYHYLSLATQLSDEQINGGTGGAAKLSIRSSVTSNQIISANATVADQISRADVLAQDASVLFLNGVPEGMESSTNAQQNSDFAVGQFTTRSNHGGLVAPRTVQFQGLSYDSFDQTAVVTFKDRADGYAYNLSSGLFETNVVQSESYQLRASDTTCLSALGLRTDHLDTLNKITEAMAIRTVSNATTADTLDILRQACAAQKTAQTYEPNVQVAVKQPSAFSLVDLAGRFAFATFNVALSTDPNDALVDTANSIQSVQIGEDGVITPRDDVTEMQAGLNNGGGTSGQISQNTSQSFLPLSLAQAPGTGEVLKNGQVNLNIQSLGGANNTITYQSTISENNSVLIGAAPQGATNVSALMLGVRLKHNSKVTPAVLENKRFEVWGQRISQFFANEQLDTVHASNLQGMTFEFVRINSDLVVRIKQTQVDAGLVGLEALNTRVSSSDEVLSSPIVISDTNEISFTVERDGLSTTYRGFLSAEDTFLFVVQGIAGDAVLRTPATAQFTNISQTVVGIGLGLPLARDIAEEVLPGDLSIDLTDQQLTSRINGTNCLGVPGSATYHFSSTLMDLSIADDWQTPSCQLQAAETRTINMTQIAADFDIPFNCENYPVCKRSDFEKLIVGFDENARPFVSTYVYDAQAEQLVYTKTAQHLDTGEDVSLVEVINLLPTQAPPGNNIIPFSLTQLAGGTFYSVVQAPGPVGYLIESLYFNADGTCSQGLSGAAELDCQYTLMPDGTIQITVTGVTRYIQAQGVFGAPGTNSTLQTCFSETVAMIDSGQCSQSGFWFSDSAQAQAFINGQGSGTLISSLNFADPALATCVQSAAAQQGILYAEALEVLTCDNLNITNTQGIEVFVSLKRLSLRNNQINSIDLGALTALNALDLKFNALDAIDLTANVNLVEINIGDNALTTVNLSQNVLLEKIFLAANQLSSIDVSAQTQLRELMLLSNRIVNIDVSKNMALERLTLSGNGMSTLDVSANVDLTYLDLRDNLFTSIDLSNNAKLETLRLSNNALSTIDLNNNIALRELELDANQLTTLNVDNNSALVKLHASNNPFTVDAVRYLDSITSITDLQYTNNFKKIADLTFTDAALAACIMQKAAESNWVYVPEFWYLSCREMGIQSTEGLEQLTALQRIFFIRNEISEMDLSNFPKLTHLDVNDNNFVSIDVSHNTQLLNLSVSGASISSIDLTKNPNLERLQLFANQLTSIDLSNNPNLYHVDLNGNLLSTIDVAHLIKLEYLGLMGSAIASIDLSNNQRLKELYLADNPLLSIDLSSAPQLTDLNINNTDIDVLDVSNNPMLQTLRASALDISSIDLSNNVNLRFLRLAHNSNLSGVDLSSLTNLTALDITNAALASIDLASNVALEELYLEGNQLTTINLDLNVSLQKVKLGNNPFTSATILYLDGIDWIDSLVY